MTRSIVKHCIVFVILSPFLKGQDFFPAAIDVFQIDSSIVSPKQSFHLSHNFVVEKSITVTVGTDSIIYFTFDRHTNAITVVLDSFSLQHHVPITVSYHYLPLRLKHSYSLRSLVFKKENSEQGGRPIAVTQSENVFTNMFGPELSKSGSLTRGFTIGSNQDLTLSSGFRLQLSGKLSDEIDIIAALTDENTPIQPQGNTQTLQEIDNVFVEIQSPIYTATLGDFQFSSLRSEFVNIHRKLQGARIDANYQTLNPQTQVSFIGGTSRGKFTTNRFQGVEGVQGPYQLTGENNERGIIVIAGSENVFIDGVQMTRGDENDYSIDYGSAEITFSSKRLITSASRIVVDFEYSDRQFTRNFIGGSITTKVSHSVDITTNYFREGDNPDAPIDISLSDSDKELLRQAGNAKAVKSGVILVGVDSLGIGKGYYSSRDTTISGSPTTIYFYNPGTPQSTFNVAFTYVGQGSGDYRRDGPGKYSFAGPGLGQYSPIIVLPTPQLNQLFSLHTTASVMNDLVIDGEYAASGFDQNRFSTIDDNHNNGAAYKLSLRYFPRKITIGDMALGSFDITVLERYKDDRFNTADRIDDVEFGRKWSTDSIQIPTNTSEEIREGKLVYSPATDISLGSSVGTLQRGNQFNSLRYDASLDLKKENYPAISYLIENIDGNDNMSATKNSWFRQKGTVSYTASHVVPGFHIEQERREFTNTQSDSLVQSSFAYDLYAPSLDIEDIEGIDVKSDFEWRTDQSLYNGEIIPFSNSFTQTYGLSVREIQNFSASTSLTLRDKSYTREFQSTNTNQKITLVKLQSRYRPFSQGLDLDLFYDASTQKTAKLERVFYKVRKGEGQYVWVDANGNGIVDLNDENEFKQDRYEGEYVALTLNSDELIPIINLKTSSRIRITPERIIGMPTSPFEKVLSAVSSETYFRIEERNTGKDINDIYFLRLRHFLNPATTLQGFQFIQQDIFIFENNPDYSFRFRFNQRKGLSQFSTGGERNYSRERSIRTRFQLSNDVSNQTDIIIGDDNAVSSSNINPQRQIQSTSLITDFSYRPEQNLEIGFTITTSQAQDFFTPSPVSASFNGQSVRTVIGFLGNGQLRFDVSREEVLLSGNKPDYSVPYELTSGRDIGKNFLWNVSSEYRLGGNVQFSLHYNGRTTSRSTVIHTGTMEVKAYF